METNEKVEDGTVSTSENASVALTEGNAQGNNMENENQNKIKTLKSKKRKKQKDTTAPRQPLTGYVRFLNDRRETVRTENPNLSFAEITKMLASEWTNLAADKKQQYLDAAEQDKERYTKEYNAYKQTDAYKLFTQQKNEKKQKKEEESKTVVSNSQQQAPQGKEQQNNNNNNNDVELSNFDIPIFTEEFLDHNKTRDAELRQLRKSNTDYEQQNAILHKHIENMKVAIEKLESEIQQQKRCNAALEEHLQHLRSTLTNGFSGVKLPGVKEGATVQNIDSYMTNLHSILLENSSHDADLLQTVRGIVARLEFTG